MRLFGFWFKNGTKAGATTSWIYDSEIWDGGEVGIFLRHSSSDHSKSTVSSKRCFFFIYISLFFWSRVHGRPPIFPSLYCCASFLLHRHAQAPNDCFNVDASRG